MAHSLKIALEPIEDDYFVTLVELLSHLLGKRLNGKLQEALLCVDVQLAVNVVRIPNNVINSLRELLEYLQIVCGESKLSCNLVEDCFNLIRFRIQLKKMAVCKSVYTAQILCIINF